MGAYRSVHGGPGKSGRQGRERRKENGENMGQSTSVERLWGAVDGMMERISALENKHAAFDEIMKQQRDFCVIERRRLDEHQSTATETATHLAKIDERIKGIEEKLEVIRTLPWKIITGFAGIGAIFMFVAKLIVPWLKDIIK